MTASSLPPRHAAFPTTAASSAAPLASDGAAAEPSADATASSAGAVRSAAPEQHSGSTSARALRPRTAGAVLRPLVPGLISAGIGAVLLLVAGLLLVPYTGDLWITQALNARHTGVTGFMATALYDALEPPFAVLLTALAAAVIAVNRRDLGTGLRFGLAVALTWLPVGAVKLLVHRPRPAADLLAHPMHVPAYDWSFPSGHVAFVAAFVISLVLLARTGLVRMAAVTTAMVAIAAVTVIVLIDGLHYPTDVAGSVVWALLAAPLMWRVAAVGPAALDRLRARRAARASA